jgi:signal transduction histidine kinase/FixJ family two-component response regulator
VLPNELRILILAPTERDGPITARLLEEGGYKPQLCADLRDLAEQMEGGCGGVILAEEAITTAAVDTIGRLLEKQESWSDLPVTIITGHGEVTARTLKRLRVFGPAGNITLLERPLRPMTLLNTVEVALRARQRQYEVRDLLQELRRKEQHQRFLAEISQVFVSSLEYRELLHHFANLTVPSLADACVVDVAGPTGELERVAGAFRGSAPEKAFLNLFTPAPLFSQERHPIIRTFKSGKAQFAPKIDERWGVANGLNREQLAIISRLELTSLVIIPLGHGTNIFGVVTFCRALGTPPFTQEDYELAEELGKRAAVSVANSKLYEQVRATNEELESRVAERTARLRETILELEAFSYTVSHDLRAPLRTLHGFSEILLQDYGAKLDADGLDFLQRIASGAERLDDLIENLLALARLGREQVLLERIELNNFIPALIREYPSLHEKSHLITVQKPLDSVLGHRSHLAQCLSNLVVNGLKFVRRDTSPKVELWTERLENNVRIWVKDNGIGIKEEHLQKIFEPFQRLHNHQEYEGSGMGLAIVRRAVQRMGGQVGVRSREGQGSQFWIDLPFAPDTVATASPDQEQHPVGLTLRGRAGSLQSKTVRAVEHPSR